MLKQKLGGNICSVWGLMYNCTGSEIGQQIDNVFILEYIKSFLSESWNTYWMKLFLLDLYFENDLTVDNGFGLLKKCKLISCFNF